MGLLGSMVGAYLGMPEGADLGDTMGNAVSKYSSERFNADLNNGQPNNTQPIAPSSQYQYQAPAQTNTINTAPTNVTAPVAPTSTVMPGSAPQAPLPQQQQPQGGQFTGSQFQLPQQKLQPVDLTSVSNAVNQRNEQMLGQPDSVSGSTVQGAPVPNTPVSPEVLAASNGQPQMGPGIQTAGANNIGLGPNEQIVPEQNNAPAEIPSDESHVDNLLNAQNNPSDLVKMGQNTNVPESVRKIANEQALTHLSDMKGKAEAEVTGNKLLADTQHSDPRVSGPASREIAKNIRPSPESDEGSYLKAYLLHRFGLTDLAKQEQIKLGAGSSLMPIKLADGTDAVIRMRADGKAMSGNTIKENKPLSDDELRGATQAMMPGGEASKTLHQFTAPDGTKHVVSVITGKNGMIRYRDDTDSKWLSSAPAGLEAVGHEDYTEKRATMARAQTIQKMRNDDLANFKQTGQHLYTQEDYNREGNNAYMGLIGNSGKSSSVGGSYTSVGNNNADRAIERTLKYEGGYNPDDGGTGEVNFGINAKNNPEVADVKHLTRDEAKKIAHNKYWKPLEEAGIEKLSPEAQDQIFDASFNQGPEFAKSLISKYGDDVNAIKQARMDQYKATNSPERFAKFEKNWTRRTMGEPQETSATSSNVSTQYGNEKQQAIKQEAVDIYEGRKAMPTGMGANNARSQAIATEVQNIARERGKPYDATIYPALAKARKDFSTGTEGKTIRSMNVAIDHLDTLREAGDALDNHDFTLVNKIINPVTKSLGMPEVTNFDGVKSIVGSEIAKAVSGAGGSALGDREEIRNEINSANGPKQLRGIIQKYQQLLAGQVNGLRTEHSSAGLPEDEFDKKLTPRTKQVLDTIRNGANSPSTGPVTLTNNQAGIDAWNSAKSGTIFITPDGKRKVKP